MTFTAMMAGWVSRHRILVYALLTLGLTAFLVAGFSPANAADTLMATPLDELHKAKGNCAYLSFCRWDDLSQTGQPPVMGIPQVFLVNLLFLIGHFIFFLLGQAYIFVDGLNIYYSLLYFGDGLFSKISVISGSGSLQAVPLVGIIVFAVLVVIAFQLAPALFSGAGSGGKSPLKKAAWMVFGILLLCLMSTASASNHNGKSPIGSIAGANNDAKSISNSDVANAAKDPTKWQPFSLGWTIAWGNTFAGTVGNIAVNALTAVTDSMELKNASTPSNCDVYLESMHNLYLGSGSTINASNNGVMGLERLYRAAVLDQYTATNFGTSRGAENAWCRVLETSKPVAQQVLIAENAQNIGDKHALYKPALDVMITSDLRWVSNKDNTSITGNSNFKGDNFGAGLATSYFAPPPSPKEARIAQRAYFAACESKGDYMFINDEWKNVIRANPPKDSGSGSTATDNSGETLWGMSEDQEKHPERNICSAMASGNTESVKKDDNFSVAVGFWDKATDASGTTGLNGKTDYQKRMTYTGGSTTDIMTILFNGSAIDMSDRFVAADGGLSGPAYGYYSASTGINWGAGFFTAGVMIFVTYLICRIAFPVVLGGAVAQFFGAAAMALIAFTLMALAIWPSKKIKSLNIRTFGVVIAGSLVGTLFTAIFLVYAGLFNFVNSVIGIRSGTGAVDGFANAVPLALAGIISYSLMKIILVKVLNFDPTNMKTALSTAANASAAPIMKNAPKDFKGAMAQPFHTAGEMFKTPFRDTRDQALGGWSKLRNANESWKDLKNGNLGKNSGEGRDVSKNSPQGATATPNAIVGGAFDKDSPLYGVIIDPTTGTMSGMKPGAGQANGSVLSDEQHRQRLMDQIKSAYGTAAFDKVFPNGLPADYAKVIENSPISEVKKLSETLGANIGPSNNRRATPSEAAENMKKFNEMGAETLRANPNGFDPSVGYAERAATMAQMFRSANPLSDKDLTGMSPEDKRNYNQRRFDNLNGVLPEGRVVSFGAGADVIKGEVVEDPLTKRSVPNAVVRSGSQNTAPMEGVTQDGTSLYGAKRRKDKDGNVAPEWGLSTLDSGARALAPSMFSSTIPPAGVSPEQWSDVNDMHSWIKSNNIQMDSTSMATWPVERRAQAGRVADVMGSVMNSMGVPMVNSDDLESLADSGVGMTPADNSFSFGELTPNSSFDPSGLRKAIADGQKKINDLRSASATRAELMVGEAVDQQIEAVKERLENQESILSQRLDERLSLENARTANHLDGLINALEESNAAAANSIADLASNGDWDDLQEMLNSMDTDDDQSAEVLRDQMQTIIGNSQARIKAMKSDHASNVARIYAELAEERESITERMHSEVESDLQNSIDRNIDGVRELAFASTSETSRRHVEGMMNWFPAIKSRFFAQPEQDRIYADPEGFEDADADGIDDRIQANL